MTKNYISLAEAAKVAARDILRMRKISKWLTNKGVAEAEAKTYQEQREKMSAEAEKRVSVVEFDATQMSNEHPLKEEKMEAAAKLREEHDKREADNREHDEKVAKNIQKKVDEAQEAIDEWCAGKRKVSREELKNLADELIKENVKAEFVEKKEEVVEA